MGWTSSNMTGVLIRDSDRHIHKRPCEDREGDQLQAKERGVQMKSTLPTPPSWTSSLQKLEKSFCCLSPPVHGVCEAVPANYTIFPFLNLKTPAPTLNPQMNRFLFFFFFFGGAEAIQNECS
ncbi:hypothetical protein HJG60_009745 [Phyllostomus discolor]|uniref:Uncharacterized protein n=1 Tax=Phyllostomus discolor TaxID=89673 RepID=A0A834EQ74_9CHIR|nr:hypothetical protein HJG60_009745 [Phyllostomus discolor]